MKRYPHRREEEQANRLRMLRDQAAQLPRPEHAAAEHADAIEVQKAKLRAELEFLETNPELHLMSERWTKLAREVPCVEALLHSEMIWHHRCGDQVKQKAPDLHGFLLDAKQRQELSPDVYRTLATHFLVLADLNEWQEKRRSISQ